MSHRPTATGVWICPRLEPVVLNQAESCIVYYPPNKHKAASDAKAWWAHRERDFLLFLSFEQSSSGPRATTSYNWKQPPVKGAGAGPVTKTE